MEEMVWISETFAPDPNETLARNLQISLSSDFPTYSALRRQNLLAPALVRASKKSRRKQRGGEAKRSPITYIRADPANFREMVQRVTGLVDLVPSPAPTTSDPARPTFPQILRPTLITPSLLLNQGAGDVLRPPAVSHFAHPLLPVFPMALESWGIMYR